MYLLVRVGWSLWCTPELDGFILAFKVTSSSRRGGKGKKRADRARYRNRLPYCMVYRLNLSFPELLPSPSPSPPRYSPYLCCRVRYVMSLVPVLSVLPAYVPACPPVCLSVAFSCTHPPCCVFLPSESRSRIIYHNSGDMALMCTLYVWAEHGGEKKWLPCSLRHSPLASCTCPQFRVSPGQSRLAKKP